MENEKKLSALISEILSLLEDKKYIQAREALLANNEVEIAEIIEELMEDLGMEKTIILFRTLPKDVSVEVFAYLPIDDQIKIINGITDKEIQYILDELSFDDMIDVLDELPANLVDKILEKTPKEERKLINTFLNYPDTCAGSLMTPDYISLQKDMTVEEALAYIRKKGMDSETIFTSFVKEKGRENTGGKKDQT
ncbi:MAG: magnesium transporter, partial [Clostridiales bacterium]|nr:magnesium transporter [Clostridiales bacterium]